MSDNIEEKLNEIIQVMKNGFDDVDKKINTIDKKLEDYIDFSSERMTKVEDAIDKSKEEVLSEIQKTKLELTDRYADKEKVIGHETRITNLEEKVFTN